MLLEPDDGDHPCSRCAGLVPPGLLGCSAIPASEGVYYLLGSWIYVVRRIMILRLLNKSTSGLKVRAFLS